MTHPTGTPAPPLRAVALVPTVILAVLILAVIW